MSPLESMMANILKNAVANLPPDIKENIDKIGQTVLAFKAQLDRIEQNQHEILTYLKPGKNHGTG